MIAKQDILIVQEPAPVRTPPANTTEVRVQADMVITRYRHWVKQWELQGWRIDGRRLRELEADGNAVLAIPSPARRTGSPVPAPSRIPRKRNCRLPSRLPNSCSTTPC